MPRDAQPASCAELLQAMVRVDTVNAAISGRMDAERPLAEWLESVAQAAGLATRRLPVPERGFNLLVTHEVAPERPWLLFESHLDTVGIEGMALDPFGGEIRDGRLWGRGACDVKGGGAAMLWALMANAREGGGPNNLALAFTLDEEVTKAGVKAFVADHLPSLGWRPAGVVVGEPTGLRLVTAHNGVIRWPLRTHGRAAHSSDPSQGRSAISMMVKVLAGIEARYFPSLTATHPLTGKAQGSVTVVRGGSQLNVIPGLCEAFLDRRIVPGEDPATIRPAVQAVLDAVCADHPEVSVTQGESVIESDSLDPRGGEAFAGWVGGVLGSLGHPPEPVGAPFGTDASNFARAGIPAVVLGPGHIAQAHTADEWIDLDALDQGVAVYRALMRAGVGG